MTPKTANVTVLLTRQFTAAVGATSETSVTWTVQEGAAGGTIAPTGLYTAPGGAGTYHVIATSVADETKSDTATVTVVVAPEITSFAAAKSPVSTGQGTSLTYAFTGGAGTVSGIGSVTSGGNSPTGNLVATTNFMLRVVNAAGTEDSAQVTVTVVPLPTIASFTVSPAHIATGDSSALTAFFTNGTASLTPSPGTPASGVPLPTGPLSGTTQYRLTVTNAAGDSVTAAASVTVYGAAPLIHDLSATPGIITTGDSTTLTWAVDSALSLSIDAGVGAVTGTSRSTLPVGSTTYTLTATNPFGSSTDTVSVTVVFAPVIHSFTATPSVVVSGGTTQFAAQFEHGSGTIDQGVGAISSGGAVGSGAIAAGTTFTLSVTNAAGRTLTRTAVVGVDPGTFAATGSMSTARSLFALVPLADGTVLALGGSTHDSETYDPNSGTWTPAGDLRLVRYRPQAVLLADGRVLAVGGLGPSGDAVWGHMRTAEIYDPISRTWALTDSIAEARLSHTLHLLADGRVLMFGGSNAGGTALTTAQVYDPSSGGWSGTGSSGPTSRLDAYAFTLSSGNVLVIGGGSSSDGDPVEIYNRAMGVFGPASGTTVGHITAVQLLDGSVLAATTLTGSKRWDNGVTTAVGTLARRRQFYPAAALLPNGEVLIQSDSGVAGGGGRSEAEIYSPATNSFRLTGRTLSSRASASVALLRTGKVLVSGGYGEGLGELATAELFDFGSAAPLAAPSTAITAPVSVAAGAVGVSISVPTTAGARYVWHVSGGTVTAGLNSSAITVTAAASGTIEVRVLVVSELQIPATGSVSIAISP
ncbi:MAG: kelch repeat-containing protein [Gemmatimonadaceae bacterium]